MSDSSNLSQNSLDEILSIIDDVAKAVPKVIRAEKRSQEQLDATNRRLKFLQKNIARFVVKSC